MKTSVEISEEKLRLARRLAPEAGTLRQLIDQALDAYIGQARRLRMAALIGKDLIDRPRNRHARARR